MWCASLKSCQLALRRERQTSKLLTSVLETGQNENCLNERQHLVFLSWSLIFFSISASVRVSRRGHHWSASPVLRMAISTVGKGFSLQQQDHKATPVSGHSGYQPRPTTQAQQNIKFFRLQHLLLAPLSPVWFSEVPQGQTVTSW